MMAAKVSWWWLVSKRAQTYTLFKATMTEAFETVDRDASLGGGERSALYGPYPSIAAARRALGR